MEKIKIPKATAKRLPLYYRYLIILNEEGKDKVSSTELSEAVQVDSASITTLSAVIIFEFPVLLISIRRLLVVS